MLSSLQLVYQVYVLLSSPLASQSRMVAADLAQREVAIKRTLALHLLLSDQCIRAKLVVQRIQRLMTLAAKLASYHRIASSRQQTYLWSGNR